MRLPRACPGVICRRLDRALRVPYNYLTSCDAPAPGPQGQGDCPCARHTRPPVSSSPRRAGTAGSRFAVIPPSASPLPRGVLPRLGAPMPSSHNQTNPISRRAAAAPISTFRLFDVFRRRPSPAKRTQSQRPAEHPRPHPTRVPDPANAVSTRRNPQTQDSATTKRTQPRGTRPTAGG
jgi:hypothetical protein